MNGTSHRSGFRPLPKTIWVGGKEGSPDMFAGQAGAAEARARQGAGKKADLAGAAALPHSPTRALHFHWFT